MQRIFLAAVFTFLAMAASTSWSWDWSRTPFVQPVRCEGGVFNAFPGFRLKEKIAGPFRDYAAKRKLKFLEFNMLNLFSGTMTTRPREAAARILRQSDPDVMILVEVESKKTAETYDQTYLNDRYQEFVIEGNDERGIDVAVLVKKDLPFEVEYRSLKDLRVEKSGEPVYSRDLPIAVFRRLDVKDAPVEFVLLGTHFKSKRGEGESRDIRQQQAEVTSMVWQSLRAEFGPAVPILLAGDFNNAIHKAPEFASLWRTDFRDALDLAPNGPPPDQRGTHFYFPPGGGREISQLDGMLISAPAQLRVTSARILPHLDQNNRPLPPPKSFRDRESRASDHLATEVEIEF